MTYVFALSSFVLKKNFLIHFFQKWVYRKLSFKSINMLIQSKTSLKEKISQTQMNIKQGSKYSLDIRHPRYSKNCKVTLRNSKDSKGFLMDSKGFQKDSNGFQKDSNGFQKDSSGFQEDSNCLSPWPTKSVQH